MALFENNTSSLFQPKKVQFKAKIDIFLRYMLINFLLQTLQLFYVLETLSYASNLRSKKCHQCKCLDGLHTDHGLRTPNEGINQRNLKIWVDVADKICFGHT